MISAGFWEAGADPAARATPPRLLHGPACRTGPDRPGGGLFRHADEAGFWAAIAAAPFDDLPRQVYADWLDDHADPHA